jgi:hypothetical protein
VDVVDLEATSRRPTSVDIAAGDPGWWSGLTKFESSTTAPPSGAFSRAISLRESAMPITVSTNSPSMNIPPSELAHRL